MDDEQDEDLFPISPAPPWVGSIMRFFPPLSSSSNFFIPNLSHSTPWSGSRRKFIPPCLRFPSIFISQVPRTLPCTMCLSCYIPNPPHFPIAGIAVVFYSKRPHTLPCWFVDPIFLPNLPHSPMWYGYSLLYSQSPTLSHGLADVLFFSISHTLSHAVHANHIRFPMSCHSPFRENALSIFPCFQSCGSHVYLYISRTLPCETCPPSYIPQCRAILHSVRMHRVFSPCFQSMEATV